MTEEERDELIEKSLLNTLNASDENRVQELLRADESFRREYEFQEKLIQQVRLKSRQDLKKKFAQFEADYQASADESDDQSTPIIPLTSRTEEVDRGGGEGTSGRRNWYWIAASVLFLAGVGLVFWLQKASPDPHQVANKPDSLRTQTPKDTAQKVPVVVPEVPQPQGPVAQKPTIPTTPTERMRELEVPYFETDGVSMGFGEGQKTDDFRSIKFLTGPEPAYEFQDTLKVYFPVLPSAKSRWSLIYNRTDDLYYLTTGTIRYELIKGIAGRKPLKESKAK